METLLANLNDRTVKGMLLPYGETSRPSNIGPIMFARGAVQVPADPMIVGGNILHNREEPVARAIELEDTPAGVIGTFAIARTPEGDQLLADVTAKPPRLNRLSPEIKHIIRDAANPVRGVAGKLFGAAFVDEGAFKTATLYGELASESHYEEEFTDENGVLWRRVSDSKTEETTAADGTVTYRSESVTTETPEAPAEDQEEDNQEVETMEAAVATTPDTTPATVPAGAPATMLASRAKAKPSETISKTSIYTVAEAMAAYFKNGDSSQIEAISAADRNAGEIMYGALSDIKATTGGSVGVNIIQPQWIGDVWAARTRPRKFSQLIGQGILTSFKVNGFRFVTKPAGGTWAGDKGTVPSNEPTTEAVTKNADRWAGGHDIAREFVDFDVPEFWVSYFQYMTNDYIKWDDNNTLGYLIAGATAVEHGEVPDGLPVAVVMLVDGALQVIGTEEATPTFAVVGLDRYRELLLQTKDNIIATLSMSLGLEEGELENFRIVPSAKAEIQGKVLVGARDAATHYELSGAPIRTNALDMAKGGVDHAFFGYSTTVVNQATALALVSEPEA